MQAGDDLVSQVLEIIGGATYEAPPGPEEPGDHGAWAADDGDDSVFHSDEGRGRRDAAAGQTDPRASAGERPGVGGGGTELQTPSGAAGPGAKPEDDGTTEAQTLTSGTAGPPEDKNPPATPNPPRFLPKLADEDAPAGLRQRPGRGYATLPTPKTSFNHLTSDKYATVSYRRIRRGNTRQKIEKFECMILNL